MNTDEAVKQLTELHAVAGVYTSKKHTYICIARNSKGGDYHLLSVGDGADRSDLSLFQIKKNGDASKALELAVLWLNDFTIVGEYDGKSTRYMK